MIYQIILLILISSRFLIHAAKHGEPMNGKFHLGYAGMFAALHIWLMYMGGFFHWIH